MSPSSYDDKREFERTPEPSGDELTGDVDPLAAPAGSHFVIQQHHATALHHDVRLEMFDDDTPVLVSWAVPKGLPRRRGQRHLAIHVEDHPIGYASFRGTIPKGEYGGGEVRIFDEGEYELIDRNQDRLTFELRGHRLRGIWHMVHTGLMNGRDQWLAIMSKDLRPPDQERPPLEPMRAAAGSEAFDDPEWLFEPKWDGVRAMSVCDESSRLVSEDGADITIAYPELQRLHSQIVALEAVLDGAVVAFDGGVPSMEKLRQRMDLNDESKVAEISKRIPVVYVAFDLLYMDGVDLTGSPLTERRELLEEAVVPSDRIQVSPATWTDGVALLEAALDRGFGGVIAKRCDSVYRPGSTSSDWLEIEVGR